MASTQRRKYIGILKARNTGYILAMLRKKKEDRITNKNTREGKGREENGDKKGQDKKRGNGMEEACLSIVS